MQTSSGDRLHRNQPLTSGLLTANGKDDAVHVVVVDDNGEVTGTQGAILERYISASKAIDAVSAVNSPDKIFWKRLGCK